MGGPSHRIQGRVSIYPDYDQVVAVKPDDPNVVYLGGIGMLRTDDAFATEQGLRRVERGEGNGCNRRPGGT